MRQSLPQPLAAALIAVIHDENVARHRANAAEPYVHADYEHHESRIHRLVAALADGDEQLEDAFYEALFDITLDGPDWMRRTFYAIVARLRNLRLTELAESLCTEDQLQASDERAYGIWERTA
jgi:hypothetical protein